MVYLGQGRGQLTYALIMQQFMLEFDIAGRVKAIAPLSSAYLESCYPVAVVSLLNSGGSVEVAYDTPQTGFNKFVSTKSANDAVSFIVRARSKFTINDKGEKSGIPYTRTILVFMPNAFDITALNALM